MAGGNHHVFQPRRPADQGKAIDRERPEPGPGIEEGCVRQHRHGAGRETRQERQAGIRHPAVEACDFLSRTDGEHPVRLRSDIRHAVVNRMPDRHIPGREPDYLTPERPNRKRHAQPPSERAGPGSDREDQCTGIDLSCGRDQPGYPAVLHDEIADLRHLPDAHSRLCRSMCVGTDQTRAQNIAFPGGEHGTPKMAGKLGL